MLLFRNTTNKQRETPPALDRKAGAVARAIYRQQAAAARWLGRKFGALPLTHRKLCLLVFCLLLGGAYGWILVRAVLPGQETTPRQAPGPWPGRQHGQPPQRLPDSLVHPDQSLF